MHLLTKRNQPESTLAIFNKPQNYFQLFFSDVMGLPSESKDLSQCPEIDTTFEEIDTNDLVKDLINKEVLTSLIFEHMTSQTEKVHQSVASPNTDSSVIFSSLESMHGDTIDHEYPISSTSDNISEERTRFDYNIDKIELDYLSKTEIGGKMKLRKRQNKENSIKKSYCCGICKTFKGSMKKHLKKHIMDVHRHITLEEYKSIFDEGETNIIKRWRKNQNRELTEKTIFMLMKKVRSYATILSEELRKLEMTSRDITPFLKLASNQEVIQVESLSRLLRICASIV